MFDDIEPGWIWAVGGVLVLIAELIAPGFFLLFIGAAAIATGVFTLLFDLGTATQLVRAFGGRDGFEDAIHELQDAMYEEAG